MLLLFAVQFIISFYISPVIVSKVGASAYGFIGLGKTISCPMRQSLLLCLILLLRDL